MRNAGLSTSETADRQRGSRPAEQSQPALEASFAALPAEAHSPGQPASAASSPAQAGRQLPGSPAAASRQQPDEPETGDEPSADSSFSLQAAHSQPASVQSSPSARSSPRTQLDSRTSQAYTPQSRPGSVSPSAPTESRHQPAATSPELRSAQLLHPTSAASELQPVSRTSPHRDSQWQSHQDGAQPVAYSSPAEVASRAASDAPALTSRPGSAYSSSSWATVSAAETAEGSAEAPNGTVKHSADQLQASAVQQQQQQQQQPHRHATSRGMRLRVRRLPHRLPTAGAHRCLPSSLLVRQMHRRAIRPLWQVMQTGSYRAYCVAC